MRARGSTDQTLKPTGTNLVREVDASSALSPNETASSDATAPNSHSTPSHPSKPMQASLPRDSETTCLSRSKSTQHCRKWLRGQCERGSSCNYLHQGLEHGSVSFLPLTPQNDPVVDFDFDSASFVWKQDDYRGS